MGNKTSRLVFTSAKDKFPLVFGKHQEGRTSTVRAGASAREVINHDLLFEVLKQKKQQRKYAENYGSQDESKA